MTEIDYSVYYGRFHDDSEEHAEIVAGWLISMLKPHVPTDRESPILDIGCGYGFALRELRNLGYSQLTGLEISHQQAERAQKAGFEVVVTDKTIPWLIENTGRFAFVMLLDVLEHVRIENQIDLARAVLEALKPGGKVLLTVPNANAILASRWRYNDYTHYSSFSEHSIYFVLKNAGFSVIEIDTEKGLRFPRRFWRWPALRKWFVRWCWFQVYKAELPYENMDGISFELNLKAIATK